MKRNGISAILLAMILGVTACGEIEQGNQEENTGGMLSQEEAQQNTDQNTGEESKQAESEERVGDMSGLEYPIFAETDDAPFIEFVTESEGIYCVYGHKRQQDCYFGFLTETGEEITPFIYEEAAPFSEGLACVYLDGKYGYIDKNGEVALPYVYDYAAPFSEGLAYFATGETYGFMDKKGETVFTLDCDSVSSFREGLAYFSIDGKYGYIDQTGVTVIQPLYDDADYFYGGRARVRVGGAFGVIDAQGREVLPAVYDSISFEEEYIFAQLDGSYYCYATDGDGGVTLLLNAEYIYKVWGTDRDLFRFTRDGKAGLADSDGTILIQPMYDFLELVTSQDLAIARLREEEGDRYGLVDLQGRVVVPFGEYDYYPSHGQLGSGLLQVAKKQGKDGVDKAGYLDLSDMTLKIPAVYDSTGSFHGGLAPVSRDGLYGLIDTDGNLVYPMEYKRAMVVNGDGTVFLLREGGAGDSDTGYLYDAQGNLLYQDQGLDYVQLVGECYELWWNNDKTGYLTLSGKSVETKNFDTVSTFHTSQPNISLGYSWGTDRNNVIIKTGRTDTAVTEIEGAILKNSVTPRNAAYFQVFQEKMKGAAFYGVTRKWFRFYNVDSCEEPLLYYYEEPYQLLNFPASESGFYQMQDGQAVEIISSYECGGSLRGDYATLWYDRETGRVLPGAYDCWGSFGGYNYDGRIYEKVGNGFEKVASFHCTDWFSTIDVEGEMQVTPELFYSRNNEPYTADTLPERDESVTEYNVNGERVTMERYQEERNRHGKLRCGWF